MMDRERERESLGQAPVKYHGKWPFKRVFGLQVPISGLTSFGENELYSLNISAVIDEGIQ